MVAHAKKLKVMTASSDNPAYEATRHLQVAEQYELCQANKSNETRLTLLIINAVILDIVLSGGNGLDLAPIVK